MSVRDLQWRRRRFVVAVVAAALVFSLTLLLGGVVTHMQRESDRIVDLFAADAFLVADGGSGPFTTAKLLPLDVLDAVRADPGVAAADPVVVARETVDDVWTNVVGIAPGGVGEPAEVDGARLSAPGQALADRTVGVDVGDVVTLGSRPFEIVGEVSGLSYNFGGPTLLVAFDDARALFLGGLPLASTIAVRGDVTDPPDGLTVLAPDAVSDDLRTGLKSGLQTVQFINGLLWLVAAGIIGSIVYLTALERARDFAVMKATGASTRTIAAGMALTALVLALASGVTAAILAALLAPTFPMQVETQPRAYVALLAVAVTVGLLASLGGVRRAVRADPALAFGG